MIATEAQAQSIARELGNGWDAALIPSINRTWPGARHRHDRGNIYVIDRDGQYQAKIRVAPVAVCGQGKTATEALANARERLEDKIDQLNDTLRRIRP